MSRPIIMNEKKRGQMKTKITEKEDIVIVDLEGGLSFESQIPFREDLIRLSDANRTSKRPKQIIFNFEKLEFVGSSGISGFVQVLKDFNLSESFKPRYCNVGSEFQKIIKAFDEEELFNFSELTSAGSKLEH